VLHPLHPLSCSFRLSDISYFLPTFTFNRRVLILTLSVGHGKHNFLSPERIVFGKERSVYIWADVVVPAYNISAPGCSRCPCSSRSQVTGPILFSPTTVRWRTPGTEEDVIQDTPRNRTNQYEFPNSALEPKPTFVSTLLAPPRPVRVSSSHRPWEAACFLRNLALNRL
jgi:hypothetical protein